MPANPNPDKDEPVKIPLDPEEALRALLAVKTETDEDAPQERPDRRRNVTNDPSEK